ncbi:MAG TPA: uracil-DNA glycosylase, partial [Candidatus Dormibacteraeota bacterium]
EAGPDDVPGAPAIRLANLRHYLLARQKADVLAVGEAAGYQGMRWSGIAFTSERDLARWGAPYHRTSRSRLNGWSEPSGTIVHGLLEELGAEQRVILWNTVPAHPHLPGLTMSNRRPIRGEVEQGVVFLDRLIGVMQPATIVAVGRIAESILGDRGALYVRHPAQSGATAFRDGMRRILLARSA